VSDVVYASIADPAAVAICEKAGISAKVELSLGGKSLPAHGRPLKITGTVLTIHAAPWVLFDTGPTGETNKMAVLQVDGIKVIITERRTPFIKIADFSQLNIDPCSEKTLVIKIGYLEPELREMAAKSFLALSPGAVNQDIEGTPYKRIKRPMYPFDGDMDWNPPENSLF
jgi:microcystin degradation protein MlrC